MHGVNLRLLPYVMSQQSKNQGCPSAPWSPLDKHARASSTSCKVTKDTSTKRKMTFKRLCKSIWALKTRNHHQPRMLLPASLALQDRHFQHVLRVVLQNWYHQANNRSFIQMRSNWLLIISKRLHVGASQIPKSDAFDMRMISSLPDLAIKMLKLAFAGLAASSTAIMIKFNFIGPQAWQLYEEVP